jgi:uncharacterized protein YciI
MRTIAGSILPFLLTSIAAASAGPALPPTALAPAEYVLGALERKPLVILGEGHWIRHDARLVAELVPGLAERRVVLAMETLLARDQAALDRLLVAAEWSEAEAMRIQRSAAWPYREYFDILRAAWEANRATPGAMRVVALGPDPDWRRQEISYDGFMADRVAAEIEAGRRVLVYCGIQRAFTRYHQPELDLSGKARAFMDRMGNILRRRFGERVFLITLHKPVWCGKEPWDYCLPLGGTIDCAAARLGRPVGFDVAGTAFGQQVIDPTVYYAHGYTELRFGEMTDGYVWLGPLEGYEDVRLIPLRELAPDDLALKEVAERNPFSDGKDASRGHLEELWREEEARRADPRTRWRWSGLLDPRCGERSVTLVYLKTGPESGKLEPAENQQVFAGHFANMARLAGERSLLLAGPFGEPRHDARLRGIFVLDTADRAQARAWAETDPAVQAGVFELEYHELSTAAPLRELLEAELAAEDAAKREGRVRAPGEGGRTYVLLTAERGDIARRELAPLVAQGRVLLVGRLDGERAFAILDAADVDVARALLDPIAGRLGAHVLDAWFATGGLASMRR